jgi:phosphatidate cytidylyltransferase
MSNLLSNWSNLQQRVLVAIIGVAVFAGLLFSGPSGSLFLFTGIIFLCMLEFCSLSPVPYSGPEKVLVSLAACLGFGILVFSDYFNLALGALLFLPLGLMMHVVFSSGEKPFEKAGWTMLGWVYLSLPWYCMMAMLKNLPYEPMLFLGLFGLLWMADSGAYFAGRSIGRTKLMPSVSPKKTWEGLGGGLLASVGLAWILSAYLTQFTRNEWLMLAVSTTLFGTLGDLAESRLKRSLELKDSGSLLPGHGGFLDRFDGFFLAAPVNYLLVEFLF